MKLLLSVVAPCYNEAQNLPEDRSKILNQFNLELALALPEYAETALIGRLQHRSGVFGLSQLLGNVDGGSNYIYTYVEFGI